MRSFIRLFVMNPPLENRTRGSERRVYRHRRDLVTDGSEDTETMYFRVLEPGWRTPPVDFALPRTASWAGFALGSHE
jgi:hypothetical protein